MNVVALLFVAAAVVAAAWFVKARKSPTAASPPKGQPTLEQFVADVQAATGCVPDWSKDGYYGPQCRIVAHGRVWWVGYGDKGWGGSWYVNDDSGAQRAEGHSAAEVLRFLTAGAQ